MKLPHSAPSLTDVLGKLDQGELARVFSHPLAPSDQYLHWDQIRHRAPPEGMNSESWWAVIKLTRHGFLRPLPIKDKDGNPFVLGMPEAVLIDLHHIDQDASGKILSTSNIASKEHQSQYLMNSLIEEAITSSQLEGAATTRKVAEAMLRDGRKPKDHGEQMIFNNYRAMSVIREMKGEPISPESILGLHRILTEDTLDDPADAGRLRQTDDVRVVDNRNGVILHQPPAYKELPDRLKLLCDFANADENSTPFVHPVVRAILLHFMIGYDHPFVDGNGRTARALFYWSMARSGYWLMEYVSISHFLKRAPSQYVKAYLYTESDSNDTTYFVIHQLGIIRNAIRLLHEYMARVSEQHRNTERILAASPKLRERLNHRQVALLTHALRHPGEAYAISGHQRTHGIVYQTARADLLELCELELLNKARSGKAFVFIAPMDLQERVAGLVKAG